MGLRPQRWQLIALYATATLLVLSGAAWISAHFFMRSVGEGGMELPNPLEAWMLRLHGIVAYAGLFVFGSMSATHIVTGWRLRRNRWSGVTLTLCLTVLAGTALLLYYAPEDWHASASALHWGLGFAAVLVFWKHRRGRQSSRAPHP
ncbi:MAG: DUF4405 domain-containing protein [Paucibacter sp.]|nr:DUF4405 domain-containing protein [Roseateles sp.]